MEAVAIPGAAVDRTSGAVAGAIRLGAVAAISAAEVDTLAAVAVTPVGAGAAAVIIVNR